MAERRNLVDVFDDAGFGPSLELEVVGLGMALLAPVFAYGAIETNFGIISISVRELRDDQISVEIVNQRSDTVPPEFEEARRWTYSTWSPEMACPKCDGPLREVAIRIESARLGTWTLLARKR